MVENEFIVGEDKKKDIFTFIVFGAFLFVAYIFSRLSNDMSKYYFSLCIYIVSVFFYLVLGTKIMVNSDGIRVKKSFKQWYTFTCKDIEKVDFSVANSTRYGTRNYIVIYYNEKPLYISSTLLGFAQMARYLLKQREDGVIQKSVFPPKVVRALNGYAKFDGQKLSKEESRRQNEIIKNAPCLKEFNDEIKLKSLLELDGSVQDTNCCFVAYQDANKVFYNTDDVVFDAYDGYLINKVDQGLTMIPFMYQRKLFLKSKIDFCGVLEQYRYFISNEEIEKLKVSGGRGKSLYASIEVKLADRTIHLLANTKEPKISYHNDGLAKFVSAYKQQGK